MAKAERTAALKIPPYSSPPQAPQNAESAQRVYQEALSSFFLRSLRGLRLLKTLKCVVKEFLATYLDLVALVRVFLILKRADSSIYYYYYLLPVSRRSSCEKAFVCLSLLLLDTSIYRTRITSLLDRRI